MSSQAPTYLLFGRKDYQQPLEFIDKVSAPLEVNETDDYVELVAVPAHAVIRVIPDEGEA